MRIRQRLIKGSLLSSFKSYVQMAHPVEIDDITEAGMEPFGLDLPRLPFLDAPMGHPARPYLRHRCHDAGVYSFDVQGNDATLRMNDYDGWRLASAYRPNHSCDMHHPELPVELVFRDVQELIFRQTEFTGKTTKLKHALRANLRHLDTLNHDSILKFDDEGAVVIFEIRGGTGRVSWLGEHPCWPRTSLYHPHNLFIGIHARHIEVREFQREYWTRHYGEESAWIWDAFTAVRDDRVMRNHEDFEIFLAEIGAARGEV